MKAANLVEICLWPHLAVKGLNSLEWQNDKRYCQLQAIAAAVILISARGLRPGSTVCSENTIDWQYLLLEDLEQIGIFPKSKS